MNNGHLVLRRTSELSKKNLTWFFLIDILSEKQESLSKKFDLSLLESLLQFNEKIE